MRGKNSRLLGRRIGTGRGCSTDGPVLRCPVPRTTGAGCPQFIIAPRSLRNGAKGAILVTFETNFF